jgi:hypothetical protein
MPSTAKEFFKNLFRKTKVGLRKKKEHEKKTKLSLEEMKFSQPEVSVCFKRDRINRV